MTKIDFVEDCIRLQKIFLSRGWEATLKECQDIWIERSGAWDAMWLILPEGDEEILRQINEYTKNYYFENI
jgi:hypothetical protein